MNKTVLWTGWVARVLLFVLSGWLIRMGFTDAEASQITLELAGVVVLAGGALWSAAHNRKLLRYIGWCEDELEAKGSTPAPPPTGPPPGAPAIALAALIGLSVALGGCTATARTPVNVQYQAQEAYIATVRGLLAARAAGKIGQADWTNVVLPLINAGDHILDDMEAAARVGDATAQDLHRTALDGVLRELAVWLAQTQGVSLGNADRFGRPGGAGPGDQGGRRPEGRGDARAARAPDEASERACGPGQRRIFRRGATRATALA